MLPTSLGPVEGRGLSLLREQKFQEATDLFNQALREHPQKFTFHLLNGFVYETWARRGAKDKNDLAEIAYQFAHDAHPMDEKALWGLGRCAMMRLDNRRAQRYLAEALLLCPMHVGILYDLARASYGAGDVVYAREILRKILEIAPQHQAARHALTLVYAALGEFNEAQKSCSMLAPETLSTVGAMMRVWKQSYVRIASLPGFDTGNSLPNSDPPLSPLMVVFDCYLLSVDEDLITRTGENIFKQLVLNMDPLSFFRSVVKRGANRNIERVTKSGFSLGKIQYALGILNSERRTVDILGMPTLTAFLNKKATFRSGEDLKAGVAGHFSGGIETITAGFFVEIHVDEIKKDHITLEGSHTFDAQHSEPITQQIIPIHVTKVTTSMMLDYGQIGFLAGISERKKITENEGFRGLKEIPLLNLLSSQDAESTKKKTVVFLVVPRMPDAFHKISGQEVREVPTILKDLVHQEFVDFDLYIGKEAQRMRRSFYPFFMRKIRLNPLPSEVPYPSGSGKSVFLEALGLVLGERVSGDRIHPQASHAELIATFNIGAQPTLETFLQEHLIPVEAGEPLILKRILARKGTHRCLVNETPVSVVTLRALGDKLGLFHHQFDAFSPAQDDTTWIDTYAHLESDIETVRSAYGAWSEARKQLSEWEREQDKLKEKQDFLTQSLDDIIALDPQPDEEDTLLTLRQKSVQKERLQRGLGEAKEALGAVHHHLLMADKVLRKISSSLAQGDTLLSRLDGLFAENEALLETLQDQERELDHPEHTLESIDDRVAELRAFARKHNVAPAELIELWATWQQQIDALEMGEEQRSSYLEQVLTTRQAYERAARQLAQKRREGATMFEKEVMEVLPSLKLSHVTFQGPDINTLSSSFVSTQEKVLQFLKEQGFEEGEISLSAPVIHDRWENNLGSNRLAAEERYKANGSLTVRTTQIDALTRSAGKSSQLFQAGLSVTSDPVRYYISDFDALRPDMLIQATKSGLVMAETMARALSVKTGHLKDASSGTFSIENPDTGRTYDQDNICGVALLTGSVGPVNAAITDEGFSSSGEEDDAGRQSSDEGAIDPKAEEAEAEKNAKKHKEGDSEIDEDFESDEGFGSSKKGTKRKRGAGSHGSSSKKRKLDKDGFDRDDRHLPVGGSEGASSKLGKLGGAASGAAKKGFDAAGGAEGLKEKAGQAADMAKTAAAAKAGEGFLKKIIHKVEAMALGKGVHQEHGSSQGA
eukprot:g8361.t1